MVRLRFVTNSQLGRYLETPLERFRRRRFMWLGRIKFLRGVLGQQYHGRLLERDKALKYLSRPDKRPTQWRRRLQEKLRIEDKTWNSQPDAFYDRLETEMERSVLGTLPGDDRWIYKEFSDDVINREAAELFLQWDAIPWHYIAAAEAYEKQHRDDDDDDETEEVVDYKSEGEESYCTEEEWERDG